MGRFSRTFIWRAAGNCQDFWEFRMKFDFMSFRRIIHSENVKYIRKLIERGRKLPTAVISLSFRIKYYMTSVLRRSFLLLFFFKYNPQILQSESYRFYIYQAFYSITRLASYKEEKNFPHSFKINMLINNDLLRKSYLCRNLRWNM